MNQPFYADMANRVDRTNDCFTSVLQVWAEYMHECAKGDWKKADQVRIKLIETFEATLDAQAAVFKKAGDGL